MELLALLSNSEDIIIPEVKQALKGYTVYPLTTIDKFEHLRIDMPVSLLLIDTDTYKLSQLDDFLIKFDDNMVILITSEKLNKFTQENLPKSVFGYVDVQSINFELSGLVERAIEKQMFKKVINLLKQTKDNNLTAAIKNESGSYPAQKINNEQSESEMFSSERFLQKKALVNFAKTLTASFDMRELFNHFIDSVMEITRVSKMSIMLLEKEGFKVKSHWGLDPYVADNVVIKKDSALAAWLSKTGRIKQKPFNPADAESLEIKSEMDLLQCIYSFPMSHKGKLIGIFNIENKITEEPFYRDELEIIYVLCNYLAAAVKDIDLYYQIWYQKEFAKNILTSMNSGVIAINREEKITIFNQQAGTILNLNSEEIIGQDLRNLPSPLGDILFETMSTGNSYKRFEVAIMPDSLPIGINSYRLLDESATPVGAGIVFNDLSDTKRLDEEKRKTDQLETINKFMAKIAHEIRTPMTSISTYAQLIYDKYKDEELNNFYTTVVSQSIQKIDILIDKLITFSSKSEYCFSKEDINQIIDESMNYISKNIPPSHKFLKLNAEKSIFINVDKKHIAKAITYLILNAIESTPEGTSITLSADTMLDNRPFVEISIKYEGQEIENTLDSKENLPQALPNLDLDNFNSELNLSLCQKIIEEHKGDLSVKSENGSNTFVIKLPVERRNKLRN